MSSRIKVFFAFRHNRKKRMDAVNDGSGPDDLLYGYTHLNTEKFELSYNQRIKKPWWQWMRFILSPVEKWVSRVVGMEFKFYLTLEYMKQLRSVDLIVAITDPRALPIALLKYWGLIKAPVIYVTMGLADRISQLKEGTNRREFFQRFYRKLLLSVECIVTLGEGERHHLAEIFNLDPRRIINIPFGVDAQFWRASHETKVRDAILSVGSDSGRDYQTLFKAIGNNELRIVTMTYTSHASPNIYMGSKYTDLELRDLYRQAPFVITPLKDVYQPSGQSASLQAMACSKAVILTHTRGLWEKTHMQHNENCYFVPPGDVDKLREAIEHFKSNPKEVLRLGKNARQTIESRYSSQHFAKALDKQINRVLGLSRSVKNKRSHQSNSDKLPEDIYPLF